MLCSNFNSVARTRQCCRGTGSATCRRVRLAHVSGWAYIHTAARTCCTATSNQCLVRTRRCCTSNQCLIQSMRSVTRRARAVARRENEARSVFRGAQSRCSRCLLLVNFRSLPRSSIEEERRTSTILFFSTYTPLPSSCTPSYPHRRTSTTKKKQTPSKQRLHRPWPRFDQWLKYTWV